jgi:hypothetical protein
VANVVFVKAKGGGLGDWFTRMFNEGTGLRHCEFALSDGRRSGARPSGTRFYTSGFGVDREILLPVDVSLDALLP